MATQLQIRRGTSSQVAAFTGAVGELVVNTTNDSVHVNDGSTAGGFELARVNGSNWANITTTANIDVGTVTADGLTVEKTSSGANVSVASLQNDGSGANTKADLDFHAANTKYATISGGYGASAPELDIKVGNTPSRIATFTETGVGIGASPYSALTVDTANGIFNIANGNTSGGTKIQAWAATPANGYLAIEGYDKEYMRIDSSGNVGIGATSMAHPLVIQNSTPIIELIDSNLSTRRAKIGGENGNVTIDVDPNQAEGTSFFSVDIDNTERMRIDSSGRVGIGESSPATDLHITNSGATQLLLESGTSSQGILLFGDADDLNVGSVMYDHSDNSMRFETSDSEHMRIDSSGNVLVNTTNAGATGLSVSNSSTISFAEGASSSLANAFRQSNSADLVLASGYKYTDTHNKMASSYASSWAKSAVGVGYGYVRFFTDAPSTDSVGTDLTPTERMRIDSSGNVGIGTSSPHSFGTNQSGITISDGTGGCIRLKNDAGSVNFDIENGGGGGINLNSVNAFPLKFSTSNTERMRIDSSGNFMVGGTSYQQAGSIGFKGTGEYASVLASGAGGDLLVGGAISGVSNGYLISVTTGNAQTYKWHNGGSQSMTLNSSGNLLVGATSTSFSERFKVVSSGQVYGGVFHATASATAPLLCRNENGVSGSRSQVVFLYDSSTVGSITSTASATGYGTSSDQRLKSNIEDADDAGSKVDAIQVRKFDWIVDGSHQDYGMVAQELQAVAPEAVQAPEDPDEMMGVDYSKLVPMLVKEIQSLRNRVAQLENG